MKTRAYTPSPGSLTVFSTIWCGYCTRLKSHLDREGISYSEVDVEQDPDAADLVIKVNKGNRTVPTVVFADGSTATNPSLTDIQSRLT
ncbi:mycoredoxin [Lysobacter korlensis]|uniref:Mycoredoxin n=1 Tax=Lysobacter korlensis TaxID=553636 RepID=A0ABV6RY35_9GAMM